LKEKLWLQQHSAEIPGTELIYDFLFENRKDVVRREKDNQTEKCPSSAPPPPATANIFRRKPNGKYKINKYGCKKYKAKRFSKCSTSKRVQKNAACSKSDKTRIVQAPVPA
jgi:hypothetical protein